jgi:hypothetical protein|tara:strand:- start:269 stop:619 length:351 start_codon:yes stop_codon:yes gene_type:complete
MSWTNILSTGASIWNGVKTVKSAVQTIFGDSVKGQPGKGDVQSLIGHKPNLNFGGKMSLMEGANMRGYAGDLRLDRPSGKSGNEWVSMQAKYLQYLNMAEEFEEPGKVRRAIKLTV